MIQKCADFAAGVTMLSAKQRERMVGNGVDASGIDPMLRDVNQYVEREAGRVTGIRYEQWQQEHPVSFENFRRVVEREVRAAIQEHDIGETMPWMHTTLGKVFAELRTFMLVGHAKNTLKALHYRDATSANQLMFGIVSEALAYTLQTSINFAQNPTFALRIIILGLRSVASIVYQVGGCCLKFPLAAEKMQNAEWQRQRVAARARSPRGAFKTARTQGPRFSVGEPRPHTGVGIGFFTKRPLGIEANVPARGPDAIR